MLRLGMRLLQSLQKGDYHLATVEIEKANTDDLNDIYADVLRLTAESFTSDPSDDLLRFLHILLTFSSSSVRVSSLVSIVLHSRWEPLTRILLEQTTLDFPQLEESIKKYLRNDFLKGMEDEMMRELMEENEEPTIDERLHHVLLFMDHIDAEYSMPRVLSARAVLSSDLALIRRVSPMHPLLPVVVAHHMNPHVYSPRFAFSTLSQGLVDMLCRKGVIASGRYGEVVDRCMPFLVSMAMEGARARVDAPIVLSLLSGLLPCLSDFRLDQSRNRIVSAFSSVISCAHIDAQPLIIKRLIRRMKDEEIRCDAEAQVVSFLIDIYRHRLSSNAIPQASYVESLGDLWATLIGFKYEDPQESSTYYQSVFLLARYQAQLQLNLGLLARAKETVLNPMYSQISDFMELRRLQNENRLNRMCLPSSDNLDLLFYSVKEALSVVSDVLKI